MYLSGENLYIGSKGMSKKYILALFITLLLGLVLSATLFFRGHTVAVFDPKGIVALQERNLIIFALLLSLIVVIPVFVLTFVFAWKFREGREEKYDPDSNHSRWLEFFWWAIPATVILVLAIVTWRGTHALDPRKPIETSEKPVTIQVVALRWKWLFIYPQQNIATVNFIQFPARTPINFELTADAPMNSFWIPQLGGQIYAMAGMRTQLHLMASEPGEFAGSAAEISGRGFAGMKFTAKASSVADFDAWVGSVRGSPNVLIMDEYNKLSQPSEDSPVSYYSWVDPGLYDSVVMKYMMPTMPAGAQMPSMQNMNMGGSY